MSQFGWTPPNDCSDSEMPKRGAGIVEMDGYRIGLLILTVMVHDAFFQVAGGIYYAAMMEDINPQDAESIEYST